MEVIAEAGGSGIQWVLFDQVQVINQFETDGYNATSHPLKKLDQILQQLKRNFPDKEIERLWFYVAGLDPRNKAALLKKLKQYFIKTRIYIEGDLLGAARACWGTSAGLVSILGTGSITCWYDGLNIVEKSPSLGYLLGDEGGGTDLGRHLLLAYYRKLLPEKFSKIMDANFDLDPVIVREHLYQKGGANQYMASFVPFLHNHKNDQFIHQFLINRFTDWLRFQVIKTRPKNANEIALVGSIAFFFQDFIFEVLQKHELRATKIIKNPLEALVIFHQKQTIIE